MTNLGLVCLTSEFASKEDRISYCTITKKRLESLNTEETKRNTLVKIYSENCKRLQGALEFCVRNNIFLYRLSSTMFPFGDSALYTDLVDLVKDELLECGKFAAKNNIRLLSHPDQFCVLSSSKPEVVQNSIRMLELEAKVFDYLGLPRSHVAPINVHIGKSGLEAIQNIKSVINDLPLSIKSRLSLENDEYKQNAESTIEVCISTGVAFLFDFHHELVSSKLSSYDDPKLTEYCIAAKNTWSDPELAVYHLSNGARFFQDRKHSLFIDHFPEVLDSCNWLEIEAKGKQEAIFRLRKSGV